MTKLSNVYCQGQNLAVNLLGMMSFGCVGWRRIHAPLTLIMHSASKKCPESSSFVISTSEKTFCFLADSGTLPKCIQLKSFKETMKRGPNIPSQKSDESVLFPKEGPSWIGGGRGFLHYSAHSEKLKVPV